MDRDAQCLSLLAYNPSARRSPDGASFDLPIDFPPGLSITLRVELPPDFPRAPPSMRVVTPGITHPWLDAHGRVVGLNELYNWDWRNSDLGVIVHLAKAHFISHPPLVSQQQQILQQQQRASLSSQQSPLTSSRPAPPPPAKPEYPQMPQIPSEFPELRKMTARELQVLLDSEEAFMRLFNSLAVVANVNQLRDSMVQNNTALAKRNMVHKAEVDTELAVVRSLADELRAARADYEAAISSQLRYPTDPARLAEALEALALETDNESERLLPRLLTKNSPDVDGDAWKQYRDLRVLHHTRMGKSDMCKRAPWP